MERAGSGWLLWAALALAVSPSLVDLGQHVATNPWARGAAMFPFLLAWLAFTTQERDRPARDGIVWLALGVAMTLVGVGGGMPRVGRPGIALAVIGLARATGAPPLRCACLAAFAIPLPTQLLAMLAPGLEAFAASLAARVASAAGAAAQVDWGRGAEIRFVVPPGDALSLHPADGGLPLAWTLAGLGWFAALLRGASLRGAAARALRWSFAAIPVQLMVLSVACAVALLGAATQARGLLDVAVPVAGAAGLALALRERRRPVDAERPHTRAAEWRIG